MTLAAGRVERIAFTSEVLKSNPCGDPATRTVPVYLPPGYDASASSRYPIVFCLTGYTGRGVMLPPSSQSSRGK